MVIQTGKLEGLFTGFGNQDTLFRFTNGTTWQQAEEKLYLASCYEPTARIIAQHGMCFLAVEGLEEWVQVNRQHPCDG